MAEIVPFSELLRWVVPTIEIWPNQANTVNSTAIFAKSRQLFDGLNYRSWIVEVGNETARAARVP